MANKHIGSSVDDFLKEDSIYEDTRAIAIKRVIAWQIAQVMKEKHISKRKLAAAMKTSRAQVERLLDPENQSIKLDTLERAANAVGSRLVIELQPFA